MNGRQKVAMTITLAKDAMIACQGDLRIRNSIYDGLEASQLAFRFFRSLDQNHLRSGNGVNMNRFTSKTVWLPPSAKVSEAAETQ